MPLTPEDVHNVAFSKPPIGRRGYNEDEVDHFLDVVEAEIARLHGIIKSLGGQV
ncbi:putative DivIVA family protein [Gordonia araii NBRC 100433]|uniref:Cell wall synthesis protein Wag31 n=1 Tax=Gordonia araii NBRC 100433 TaxID=1073574 RepID=G7H6N6_9ACTN|nr:putative DivIVA family protein [Gordonia araii NBRC 100433]